MAAKFNGRIYEIKEKRRLVCQHVGGGRLYLDVSSPQCCPLSLTLQINKVGLFGKHLSERILSYTVAARASSRITRARNTALANRVCRRVLLAGRSGRWCMRVCYWSIKCQSGSAVMLLSNIAHSRCSILRLS